MEDTLGIIAITPPGSEFTDVMEAISQAARLAGEYLSRRRVSTLGMSADGLSPWDESLRQRMSDADLVVADVSSAAPDVSVGLGYAQALNKSVVLIARRDATLSVPSQHRTLQTVYYNRHELHKDLVPHLTDAIIIAQRQPEHGPEGKREIATAFVSYSHSDEAALRRLLVHLKPLHKRGIVDVWEDTRIKPGDRWREEIEAALSRAAIAVLLISADFLSSDFIVDNELPPLLRAAETEGTRILPVVLTPCAFARNKTLSPFQAINDPSRPVLLLPPIEQEAVWDKVAQAIEIQVGNEDL